MNLLKIAKPLSIIIIGVKNGQNCQHLACKILSLLGQEFFLFLHKSGDVFFHEFTSIHGQELGIDWKNDIIITLLMTASLWKEALPCHSTSRHKWTPNVLYTSATWASWMSITCPRTNHAKFVPDLRLRKN
jgi:hypothetical protein